MTTNMKKMMTLLSVAFMASAMVSCSTDDVTPTAQGDKVVAQFSGNISVNTRAAGDAWTAGDQIGIFMTTAGKTLAAGSISEGVDNVAYETAKGESTFSPIKDGKTVYFPIDGNVDFYAYYPYSKVTDYKVTLNVADQTDQEAIDFMYVTKKNCNKATPKVDLLFNHQLSNLVLDIQPGDGLTQNDLSKLTVTVKGQNTTATFNLADGTVSNAGTPADIVLNPVEKGKKYEAILIPTDVTGRQLVFNLNNGYDAPFVWTMPTKLEAGSKYHYTSVKLSRTAAEVTGTIQPWNEQGDNNEHIAK